MQVQVDDVSELRFADGTVVTAASALAPLAGGWLVAQDDSTFAAWVRDGGVEPLRLVPPVEGLNVFREAEGTKHLKPDLEAATQVQAGDGTLGALLLGSGSSPRRMRGVLVLDRPDGPEVRVADLTALYEAAARALGLDVDSLNFEGVCRSDGTLRWFNRGSLAGGVPTASVDLDHDALVAAFLGRGAVADVGVGAPRRYDLGEVQGVGLAATDAVALPDGRLLLSAAAEDTPNAVDDGPVVGSALALLAPDRDDDAVLDLAPLPVVDGLVHKVEGLGILDPLPDGVRLLAVVDADDPGVAAKQLSLTVRW